MDEGIIDFNDYAIQLTKKLRLLRHYERCIFSAWCAEHLLESHARRIESNLSKADRQILRGVIDAIWDILLDGAIPDTAVLNELDAQFMEIDPISADPVVTGVQNLVGLCILGCRRNSVDLAQAIAGDVVEVHALELAERDPRYAETPQSRMLTHPVLKKELEAQLAMIQHLRGEYSLDSSFRSMFRT